MTNPSELNEALVKKICAIGERYCKFSHSYEDLRLIEANCTNQLLKAIYHHFDRELSEKGEGRKFSCDSVPSLSDPHEGQKDLLFTSIPTRDGESLLSAQWDSHGGHALTIQTRGVGYKPDTYVRVTYYNKALVYVTFGTMLNLSGHNFVGPDDDKFVLRPRYDGGTPHTIARTVWKGAIQKVMVLNSLIAYWRELAARPDSKAMQRSAKRFRAMTKGSDE